MGGRGCHDDEPVIMTPPIENDSKELKAAVAAEMKSLNGPFPRDKVVVSGCSVMKRMVIDYGDLQRRTRVVKDIKYEWVLSNTSFDNLVFR